MTKPIPGPEIFMHLFFDCLYFLLSLVYIPILFLRRKWHGGLLLRCGSALKGIDYSKEKRKNVWIHAVSVGEVNAIAPLVEQFLARRQEINIFLTVTTQTGYELALKKWQSRLPVFWSPLDFSWVVKKYISQLRPDIYVIAETEIWPNLLSALFRKKIPVVVINGRISPKAFGRYQWARVFLQNIFKGIKTLYVQTQQDADRFRILGASPRSIFVVGNLKFDQSVAFEKISRKDLGIGAQDLLWVAGSTHAKEEEILLQVYTQLRKEFPSLRLIIAPRHVERSEELQRTIYAMGLKVMLFSNLSRDNSLEDMICMIDKIGSLRSVYHLADVVFVGKSLLPPGGGQNVIEPAFFAKPIVVGAYTQNFADIIEGFLAQSALIQIKSADELGEVMRRLLTDAHLRSELGQKAQAVVQKQQGVTQQTFQMIQKLL